MKILNRVCCGLLLVLSLAVLSGCAQRGATASALEQARANYLQHPYQPAAINNLALQLVKAGDAESARILLYRAVRIAPDRLDIRENLLRLEGGSRLVQAQLVGAGEAKQPMSETGSAAGVAFDEPGKLWPLPSP